jgi:hypothetical protein
MEQEEERIIVKQNNLYIKLMKCERMADIMQPLGCYPAVLARRHWSSTTSFPLSCVDDHFLFLLFVEDSRYFQIESWLH